MLRGLQRAINNLLARAVVTGLDTATKCQMLQVDLLAGEPKENVEHLEPYGFTSAPLMGAEGVALFPDGDRSHGVVLMVSDRRYRIKGLKGGEVAIYTDEGDSLIFKRGNITELQTKIFHVTATDSMTVDTKFFTVNADDSMTINTKIFTVNADNAMTVKTNSFTVTATVKATMTAPAIGLNGSLTVSDVNGGAAGSSVLRGNLKILGDQETVGISKARDHLSGIVSGIGHGHTGVQSGKDVSGGPV
ncbi:MAG: phage baseplate assembly protein V [Leclercia adecarboxylata]|nr:phage baseplate assembly protein V [Leclercia adecarboxylata]MDU1082766.1 phage baseplate assembly protein V [Leclercia adecarboxylata]